MARIVGIDLGTTNSLVAYMKDGDAHASFPAVNGRTMVPSVVAMTDNGLIVGDPAKEHLTRNPERTVYSVKRFMGKGSGRRTERTGLLSPTPDRTGRGHPDQARREILFAPADFRHDLKRTQAAGRSASR